MTKNEMNRLIAERCEGLEAIDDQWVKHRDRGGEHGWHDRVPIDDYFTDISACVRAAKALVAKLPDTSRLDSPSFDLTVNNRGYCKARVMPVQMGKWSRGEALEPAAALAAALVEAVK